jgi:hypothetical protein
MYETVSGITILWLIFSFLCIEEVYSKITIKIKIIQNRENMNEYELAITIMRDYILYTIVLYFCTTGSAVALFTQASPWSHE